MKLAEYQHAMGKLLLEREGYAVLDTDDAWQDYLKSDDQTLVEIPREKLLLYETLLFNSVDEYLGKTFPYVKRLLGDAWLETIEDFRRSRPNPTFQLWLIGAEFADFLETQTNLLKAWPFIADLARFHWAEAYVQRGPKIEYPADFQPTLNFGDNRYLFWNPVSVLIESQYPIQQIIAWMKAHPESLPEQYQNVKQTQSYFIYSDSKTYEVRCFELNAISAALINLSKEQLALQEVFKTLQSQQPELQTHSVEELLEQARPMLETCFEQNLLLGTANLQS